ncbi:MAG: tail fiber domain-containing protein [Actinomycetota bacterium]
MCCDMSTSTLDLSEFYDDDEEVMSGIQFGSPNAETGMSNIVGSGRADLRFDGNTLKLVVGLVGGPPPLTNGIVIDTSGNVSIGNVAFTQGKLNVTAFGSQYAVFGISNDSVGVYGRSVNNYGVYGESSGGGINSYAGFFNGRTHVGNLEVTGLGTAGATAVCYNSLKLLASCSSSLRYKKDIQPFGDGLSFINQLNPIAYRWKADNMPDTGFGAEDVAKINPLFVTYNDQGEVEGVKYDRLSVVFVNAFKQQQTQIGEQKKLLAEQQIQIENLKKLLCLDHPKADFCQEK